MSRLTSLKSKARSAVIAYRRAGEHLDCGANLAAVINPEVGRLAREANEALRELKAIDPDFPTSWTPYPEGT